MLIASNLLALLALPVVCFCLQISVVMDYANGGSLFEYVQARTKLPEALARWERHTAGAWGLLHHSIRSTSA